jgi:arylsulfatase A-like enzyme
MGWDELRQQRFARQQASGLIPSEWKLSPRDSDVPAWNSLDGEVRRHCASRMAAYAAMIDRIDQKIGDLLDSLKKNGDYENTLILFLSDNGACAEASLTGIGDPMTDRAPHTELTLPSYGKSWANVSATPYRLYKHFAHEGGSNTNFIAHWPARIQPGRSWYRQPAQIIDVMATLVDLTGAAYPAEFMGQSILPSEGISLTPAFDGKPLNRTKPLFMEHENNAFVRDGDWKLVGQEIAPPKALQPQKWELYHLSDDGTEIVNLASAQPEQVAELSRKWESWAEDVGVFPKPVAKRKRN